MSGPFYKPRYDIGRSPNDQKVTEVSTKFEDDHNGPADLMPLLEIAKASHDLSLFDSHPGESNIDHGSTKVSRSSSI